MNPQAYWMVIIGAFIVGYYNVYSKQLLAEWKGREAIAVSLLSTTTGFILLLYGFLFETPRDRGEWLSALAVTGIINIGIVYLNILARSKSDVSLVTPISATTPAILLITSFVILNETPSAIGWLGIVSFSVGSYVLGLEGFFKKKSAGKATLVDYLAPIIHLKNDVGVQCALGAACLGAISLNYDGILARHSPSVAIGVGLTFLIAGAGNLVIATWKKEWSVTASPNTSITKMFWCSVIWACGMWFFTAPFQWTLVPYVGSLKRIQIPITIILAMLMTREGRDSSGNSTVIQLRLVGGIFMGIGAVLLGVS